VSTVEDTRKLMQNVLVPELREMKVRLDAVERTLTEGFSEMRTELRKGFDRVERQMDIRNDVDSVKDKQAEMGERLARIESTLQH
jgi:hypothetical protein